ncbi:DUF1841 family protein [Chromobacterium alticapitis]|uniref:DUF1841 domain-containing protein n=1 Tax=Chromobacterium alticapitis TaxID=2073169 RepID=A0A2S5DDM5_9NEIS|nr:DUF1841 family protein [Chromobacterium alticapitis]POZ61203.1 DUF1841 domain-containing protein [Chromobacterium alticapitis]
MLNGAHLEVRLFLCDVWEKYCQKQEMSKLERMTASIIAEHPEFHTDIDKQAPALQADFTPEGGRINPYLHLSLHLAIEEQLQMDFPPGIANLHRRLTAKCGSEHESVHQIMDCFVDIMLRAERDKASMNPEAYIQAIRIKAESSRPSRVPARQLVRQ